jgi:ABC-type polysaccharide/polyol phosphate transport system ATPase subunit
MAYIRLDNLSLTFRVRQHRRMGLKEFLLQRLLRPRSNPWMKIRALLNLNLEFREGERVGVIGHNGAGKSTLLKVLAGVYPPTRGQVHVQGQISSLFDLFVGFEPEASGWENIAYRGYLQGETPASIRQKANAIAEFSELGDFLDTPVRYYSSGMAVRLALSIATAVDPEILLVDEVLSAGDMAFQQKARGRMHEMINKARLIVMVSHDLEALPRFCERVIWMDHGTVRMDGPTRSVIDAYANEMRSKNLPLRPVEPDRPVPLVA